MAFKSKVTPNIGLVGTPSTVTAAISAGLTVTVIGLSLANTTAAAINVSVKLNKNGETSGFLVKDAAVLPGGALVIVGGDQKVVLEESDSITAYSNTASQCDVIVSYLA